MAQAVLDMVGRTLYDADHQKIGKIDNIYVRGPNKEPVFASVSQGFLGRKETLVPLSLTHFENDNVVADTKKDVIKDAPTIGANSNLTHEDEQKFYQYYTDALQPSPYATAPDTNAQGTTVSEQSTEQNQPAALPQSEQPVNHDELPAPQSAGPDPYTMTRSEEEIRVGTQNEESGRVRLEKYVVTENVNMTVPVSHEEVRLEREPITNPEPQSATTLGDQEQEIILHQETPVVDKQVVPKETVRMDKQTVEGQQTIHDQLRKEEIKLEGETGE